LNLIERIEQCKLDEDKSCFITGEPGTGKTYVCKELQQEVLNKVVDGNRFKVCTPTHKSALIANVSTILNCLVLILLTIPMLNF
jgi:type II secretory pathway predicted ATPase ExeA